MDFTSIISFLPERWRALALTLLALAVVLQQTATAIVALLPASTAQSPRWGWLVRALHLVSNARFRTEVGTLKLPGQGVQTPDSERAALIARLAELDAQGRPTTAPPAPRGSPGRATVGVLLLLAFAPAGAVALGCHPQPGPSGSPTEVSSWTSTARTVLSSLEWIVPAARALLSTIFGGAAEPVVARSLDAVADAASRLNLAVDAYEHRGGDRCAAHAAVGAVGVALVQLAQVLTDRGIALGRPIEHVVDAAGGLADTLTPACSTDAGFGSVGDGYNRTLRTIEASAASRGVFLRRDLDGLRPLEGAR